MAVIGTNQPVYHREENASENMDATDPGPLLSLRISSLATKGQRRDSNSKIRPYRESNKLHKSEKIIARTKAPDSGFSFDLDLPDVCVSQPSVDTQEASKSQGSHLATIFLNSSKAYNSKYNIIDPLKSKDSSKGANSSDRARIHVSRSTQERAEMVKFCFDLKYLWIERSLEVHGVDSNFHSGIDGVYNPLQVIRNRIVRQNLHHQPNPNNYKMPPLACDAFSSHNSPGKIRWKLLWGIDSDELTFDMAWRKMYWYELRNAQGELWFPRASKEEKDGPRLHDKLWANSDVSGEWLHKPLSQVSLKAETKKHKRKSLKERAKRFYASSYNSNSDSDGLDLSFGQLASSSDTLAKFKMGHLYRSSVGQSTDRHQFEISKSSDYVPDPRRNSSKSHSSEDGKNPKARPPLIVVGYDNNNSYHSRSNSTKVATMKSLENADPEQLFSINDVNFNSGHQEKSSVVELEYGDEPSEVVTTPQATVCDADERVLSGISDKTKYLESLTFLDTYYMSVVHPAILKRVEFKVNRIVDDDLNTLKYKISDVNYSLLPARQSLHKAFQDEVRSILRIANEDCAAKTDNLLTATDRLYGELNTSLMMELRKSSKRIDKANQSLFGSLISSSLVEKENLPLPIAGNYRFFYLALENLIVIVLHITWIIVTILKFFTSIVRMFWKMVSFFFC